MIEHISAIIAEDPSFDPSALYHNIGSLLISYEAACDEKDAESLCGDIAAFLEEKGIQQGVKENSHNGKESFAREEWLPATEEVDIFIRSFRLSCVCH